MVLMVGGKETKGGGVKTGETVIKANSFYRLENVSSPFFFYLKQRLQQKDYSTSR